MGSVSWAEIYQNKRAQTNKNAPSFSSFFEMEMILFLFPDEDENLNHPI
jgi:hypothetical protein